MRDAPSVTSVGQASAALGTTAGEHLAAILRGHSLAEAVLLGALTLLGLIGTEHCIHLHYIEIRRPLRMGAAALTRRRAEKRTLPPRS